MKKLLFVCTGNFYRSRLAEILFNYYAGKAGLDWKATSRGLALVQHNLGLSQFAAKYLAEKGLGELADSPRNPATVAVDDFAEADLVVLMSRSEHLPVMTDRFAWMVRALEARNALRCWNVYDVPVSMSLVQSLLAPQKYPTSQPPDSGMEHVDFAVQALVGSLKS
jgi:protein-tyrosine phosphatase